jgi:choline dehydrogenase-like flavoprotein
LNSRSQINVGENYTSILWNLSEKDLENYFEIIKAVELLTKDNGFSLYYSKKIETIEDLAETALPAFHLSGTTRMSKKATDAVVDENCKLLNIENCYILGSSVFTTAGWINPTLTIMALSIRTVENSWL